MNGFIVHRLQKKYATIFYEFLSPLVASGKIKHKEEVRQGLEEVSDFILAVQKGTNKAKAIIHVADE